MNILAIDTAATCCSVMLLIGGKEFSRMESSSQRHSRHILRMINESIEESGAQLSDLNLLAWNAGPGSFTGLRIGASVVQSLAYSLHLPILSLSSLEILAHAAWCQRSNINETTKIAVAVDARMNSFYWASFVFQRDCLQRIESDQLLDNESFKDQRDKLTSDCLLAGDAWSMMVGQDSRQACIDVTAKDVMALAVKQDRRYWLLNPSDCLPNYVQNTTGWQKRRRQEPPDNLMD